jgi:hypothetical protein
MNKQEQDDLVGAMEGLADDLKAKNTSSLENIPETAVNTTMTDAQELFMKHNKAINMDAYPGGFSLRYRVGKWIEDHNPFGGYQHVGSADEYINMPYRQRTVWLFWYKSPIISCNGKRFSWPLGSKDDRNKVDAFIKRKFPIQFFIRDVSFSLKCKLSRLRDWISYTLRPRQKWLAKQIPKSWCDKTHLIQLINFAMVVHFIEEEKALDVTDWEASSPQADKFSKELMDCYNYIKVRRPQLEKEHDNSYPTDETRTGVFDVDYAETNRLEVLLDKEDTKYLTWIVINREYFWT